MNRILRLALFTFTFAATVGQSALAQGVNSPDPTAKPAPPPGPQYGRHLKMTHAGIGPVMDVAADGKLLYAVGGGKLFVLDPGQPGPPRVVGRLEGLGHVRQIALRGAVACITSREDGLFIVDLTRPERPVLASRYDTIELATGIAISGQVAAVANRFAGVELVDIADPRRPRHLSTVRVGEAQSVTFQGHYLYAGVWATDEIAVIDVSDPLRPRLVAKAPLDGHGDGVAVRGNLLLAATGHHSRARPAAKPGDPGFGRGHGLELFDISDPAKPRHLSRIKFPPLYRLGMDMWGVAIAGDMAIVNDTTNGLFLVDIRDPAKPRCAGHCQLPVVEAQNDPSPAAGLVLAGGKVYVAGAWSDLHIMELGVSLAREPAPDTEAGLRIPAELSKSSNQAGHSYKPEGQVHAALPWRVDSQTSLVLVAAGNAGLHVVRLRDGARFDKVAEYPTRGFATDVAFHNDRIYVAEGDGGLSIWKADSAGRLVRTGAYAVPGESIRQVVLADQGRIAFLAVGASRLQAVRLNDDGTTTKLLDEKYTGLFYRMPLSPVALDDCKVLCQWHVTGLYEYEAADGTARFTGRRYLGVMATECGSTALGCGKWLATGRSGYDVLDSGGARPPDLLGQGRIKGAELAGKPSTFGNLLFIANPFSGVVQVLDIADLLKPRLQGKIQLDEHPGRVRLLADIALIPAGYQGLLAWDWRKDEINGSAVSVMR